MESNKFSLHSKVKTFVMMITVISLLVLQTINPLVASAQNEYRHRWLYDNDELFDQLSGAARNVLEKHFGKKDKKHSKNQSKITINGELSSSESASEAKEKQEEEKQKGEPPDNIQDETQFFPNLFATPANVLANNPNLDTTVNDTQSETTLVLGTGSNVIASYVDSGSRQNGAHFTGYSLSTDRGLTFADRGTLPDTAVGDGGDPSLARDIVTGTNYLACLGFNTNEQLPVFRFHDNNNQITFDPTLNGAPGYVGTGAFQDKPWITVDNFAGPEQGNVYLVWRVFANHTDATGSIRFARLINGSQNFEPNLGTVIADAGNNNVQGAFVTVAPDHSIYVFWYEQIDQDPNLAGIQGPAFIRSRRLTLTNNVLSLGPVATVANLRNTTGNGDLGIGGFRTNSFPQAAVNPANGNVYVVYNDTTAGTDRADVYFTQSTNAGSSWSNPVRVNDDATTRHQWQPVITVTPDGSRLFISFYDRRLDGNNMDTYGTIGTISGATVTFDTNSRISTQSFPAVFGQDPRVNNAYMGDYDRAVSDDNFFYYSWGDNRNAHIDVNVNHPNQPDVRAGRIATTSTQPPYQGYFDGVNNCVSLAGWAWNPNAPNAITSVDIYDNGAFLARVTANWPRQDLANAGIGNGYHAFVYNLPQNVQDGQAHSISVRFAGTNTDLNWSPKQVVSNGSLFGSLAPASEVSAAGTWEEATQFTSSINGKVVAIRYYRSPNETGSHVGSLWTDGGVVPLAQVNFINDAGPGWHEQALPTPVNITAGVVYRVSYNVNTFLAKTFNGIGSGITNGPLTAFAGYYSTPAGTFPNTRSGSNFFADVRFCAP